MAVEKDVLLQRLRTTEGHLHAIRGMIEDGAPCQQVLHQLNAVRCAIEAAGSQILCLEVERCLQGIRENPSPEHCEAELQRLLNLYPFTSQFKRKFTEASEEK